MGRHYQIRDLEDMIIIVHQRINDVLKVDWSHNNDIVGNLLESDWKSQKWGVAEPPYHTQVWEYPHGVIEPGIELAQNVRRLSGTNIEKLECPFF